VENVHKQNTVKTKHKKNRREKRQIGKQNKKLRWKSRKEKPQLQNNKNL
jgi:hypothetical protein